MNQQLQHAGAVSVGGRVTGRNHWTDEAIDGTVSSITRSDLDNRVYVVVTTTEGVEQSAVIDDIEIVNNRPQKVVCACANNSVGRGHRAGATPCGMLTADQTARFWIVGIYKAYDPRTRWYDGAVYARIFRAYNTVAGAQKHFNKPLVGPLDWDNLDWTSQTYQIVRNPAIKVEA